MNDSSNQVIPLPVAGDLYQDKWDPGFQGDRWVVVSKLGPWVRVYKRPARFTTRFYHKLVNLPVNDWSLPSEANLFAGLCTIRADLEVRFQPTISYVEKNLAALPDLATHIKSNYEGLLKDAVERELLRAEEGGWIKVGLEGIEWSIEMTVNETLVAQNIQCRASCTLEPSFKEISPEKISATSGHFRHNEAYIELMRRNHEFQSQQNKEV